MLAAAGVDCALSWFSNKSVTRSFVLAAAGADAVLSWCFKKFVTRVASGGGDGRCSSEGAGAQFDSELIAFLTRFVQSLRL